MGIKRGDYVARKSYNKDIIFIVDRIIKLKNGKKYLLLKGVTIRVEADAPLEDIEKVEKTRVYNDEKTLEKLFLQRIKNNRLENKNFIVKTGKILHLDGDCNFVYILQSQ